MPNALPLFLLSALASFLLARFLLPRAFQWRLVDRPGHRKTHARSVAYLGGVAVMGGLALSLLLVHCPRDLRALLSPDCLSIVACLTPALAGLLLGLWDDAKEIRPRTKLYGQLLIALAFAFFGYRLEVLHLPGLPAIALGPSISIGVTVFFVVALVNGMNMIDGSDALALSSTMSTLLILVAAFFAMDQPSLSLLALGGLGACLGFLYWNRPPARMYLGDAGSLGLGFLVAALIVAMGKGAPGEFHRLDALGLPWQPIHYRMVLAFLLAGYPAMEVTLSVLRRGLQGKALGRGDQGHLHHRLARLGARPGSIALLAFGFNILCGAIVLAFMANERGLTAVLTVALAIGGALMLQRLGYTRLLERRWLDERKPHFAIASHFMAMQEAKLSLALNIEEAFGLVRSTLQELGAHEMRITLRTPDGKPWTWNWLHEEKRNAKLSSPERLRLPELGCHASWNMEIHASEPELDMEIRVLMSEFMKKALGRLQDFLNNGGQRRIEPMLAEGGVEKKPLSLRRLKGRL